LSGAELALTILVAATGIRISEAMGLKWEDVDYHGKQINLRRVWVKDTIVERLKTEDSAAPVPLTDLLAAHLRNWQRETAYGQTWRLGICQRKEQGSDSQIEQCPYG
jgi:integrase